MTVSYNWLKDYLKFDLTPEKVAEVLTFTGLEVEHVETVEQIPGGLAGVVVAEVLECVEHPDSDHLHITKLNIGEGEPLQVVCGAPNVAAGQKVMLATVGTKLVDIHGEELKLKKSKIRGVESLGMICAQDELGIGEDHSGIMVLDPAAVPGTPAKDYLNLACDTVYEIGLTPNRIDGASHIGVARDLYAWCRLNGVTIQPWSPFQHGFFAGPFIGNPDYQKLNDKLDEIAAKYDVTPTGMAIAWILRHPAKMQPIVGTTNLDRLAQIAKAADVTIIHDEWYELYRASGKTLP